jgi:cyclic pyranopterin phosphate synthase
MIDGQNEPVTPAFTKDNLPDSFCAVPFATLIFNSWGNVGGCRELGNEHHLGDAREQNWEEIWNGEKARAWRREFLTGNIKTCKEHQLHRKCHKEPFNQELISRIDLAEVQTKPPSRISPDFNGKCNLQCPMCTIWQLPNGLYDKLGFWESAEKNLFPFIKQVDPLSGEPFIQKDTYRLMDIMGRVNPRASWRITTNAHWKFTPFIKERLDKVEVAGINVSLDAVSQGVYAKVRKLGDISVPLKTIDDLIAYAKDRAGRGLSEFTIDINMTVQKDNWHEMGDLVKLALGKGARPLVQLLYRPPQMSLLSFDEAKRIEILDYYFETLDWEILKYCRRPVVALLDSLEPSEMRESRMQKFANIGTVAQKLDEAQPEPPKPFFKSRFLSSWFCTRRPEI